MIRPRLWKLALAGLLAFGLQLQAGARAATFVTFDPPGSTSTTPSGITPDGVITGYYTDASGVHGFLRAPDGTFTTFAAPNGGSIEAPIYNSGGPPPGINLAGTVAGTYFDSPSLIEHGFLRATYGIVTAFDVPGSTNTEVLAINPSGTIIGDFNSPTASFKGFLRTPDGKVTTIEIPGGSCGNGNSIPIGGINPAGAIAGQYSDPSCGSPSHGYLRTPEGTIITFDPPGVTLFTEPMAINPAGAIAGWFAGSSGAHGFLRTPDGTITTFDPPGSVFTEAFEINPAGVIIGIYFDANFTQHGFMRFP